MKFNVWHIYASRRGLCECSQAMETAEYLRSSRRVTDVFIELSACYWG